MGQLLNAVADYNLSVAVGIILVAVISYLISVFGYRFIQVFETYSWIVTFVLLCVLLGQAAPYVNTDAPSQGASSLAITGTFLSVLAVNMSNAIGWSTIASDYTVNYKATTSRVLVFSLVYFGLVIFSTYLTYMHRCTGALILTLNSHFPRCRRCRYWERSPRNSGHTLLRRLCIAWCWWPDQGNLPSPRVVQVRTGTTLLLSSGQWCRNHLFSRSFSTIPWRILPRGASLSV